MSTRTMSLVTESDLIQKVAAVAEEDQQLEEILESQAQIALYEANNHRGFSTPYRTITLQEIGRISHYFRENLENNLKELWRMRRLWVFSSSLEEMQEANRKIAHIARSVVTALNTLAQE